MDKFISQFIEDDRIHIYQTLNKTADKKFPYNGITSDTEDLEKKADKNYYPPIKEYTKYGGADKTITVFLI